MVRNEPKYVEGSIIYTAGCCPALPKYVYSIHIPSTLQALWECSQNTVLRLKPETTNLRAQI